MKQKPDTIKAKIYKADFIKEKAKNSNQTKMYTKTIVTVTPITKLQGKQKLGINICNIDKSQIIIFSTYKEFP